MPVSIKWGKGQLQERKKRKDTFHFRETQSRRSGEFGGALDRRKKREAPLSQKKASLDLRPSRGLKGTIHKKKKKKRGKIRARYGGGKELMCSVAKKGFWEHVPFRRRKKE